MPERSAPYPIGRRSSAQPILPPPSHEAEGTDYTQQQLKRDSLLPDAPVFHHAPAPAVQSNKSARAGHARGKSSIGSTAGLSEPRTLTFIETLDAAKAARKSVSYSQQPPLATQGSKRHQKSASTSSGLDVNGEQLLIATAATAAPVISPLPPAKPTSTSSSNSNSSLVARGRASTSASGKSLPLAVNTSSSRYKPSGLSKPPGRASSPTLSVSSGHTGWGSSHGFAGARSTRSASKSPSSPQVYSTPPGAAQPAALTSIYRHSPQRTTASDSPSEASSSVVHRRSSVLASESGFGSSSPSSVGGSDTSRAALLRHVSPGTSVVSGGTSHSGSPSSLTDFTRRTDSPLLRRSSSNNVSVVGSNVSSQSRNYNRNLQRSSMAMSATSLHGLLPNPIPPAPPKKADADLLIPRGATRRAGQQPLSMISTTHSAVSSSSGIQVSQSPRESARQRVASPTVNKSPAPSNTSSLPNVPSNVASPRVAQAKLTPTLSKSRFTAPKRRAFYKCQCLKTKKGRTIFISSIIASLFLLALLFYFIWPIPPSLSTTRQNTGSYTRSTGVMTQSFYLQAISKAYIGWQSTSGMSVQSMTING